jgi:hypothetical protein
VNEGTSKYRGENPRQEEQRLNSYKQGRTVKISLYYTSGTTNNIYYRNRVQMLGSANQSDVALGRTLLRGSPEQSPMEMGTTLRRINDRLPKCISPRGPEPRHLYHLVGWSTKGI